MTVTDCGAVRTYPRQERSAPRRRRVHRSRESSPLQVAAAVDAAGVVLLERRSRRAYVQLVEQALAAQRRRADFRASVMAVVGVLLLCTDWASRTTRPTRRVMAARGDVVRSERTVTRVVRWLHEAGLLATVAGGRRGEYAPGGAWSTTSPEKCTGLVTGIQQPANEAAVYALTQPGLTVSPPSRSPYVEETNSSRAREGETHSEPLRGQPISAATPHPDPATLGIALPSFWISLMLIIVFALKLGWLPSSGSGSWKHYVLPVAVLAIEQTALMARVARGSTLDVLRQDYVTTARAKGLAERSVIARHVVRNAMLPIVTIIGLRLAFLLSGTIIVETIFAWPGIGRLFMDSVFRLDYQVVQAIVLLLSALVVVTNLLTDMLYAVIDPRIRLR